MSKKQATKRQPLLPFGSSPAGSSNQASMHNLRKLQNEKFVCGDAFKFLADLPDESADLVVTDPPYESLELHRGKGTTTRLTGDWLRISLHRDHPFHAIMITCFAAS